MESTVECQLYSLRTLLEEVSNAPDFVAWGTIAAAPLLKIAGTSLCFPPNTEAMSLLERSARQKAPGDSQSELPGADISLNSAFWKDFETALDASSPCAQFLMISVQCVRRKLAPKSNTVRADCDKLLFHRNGDRAVSLNCAVEISALLRQSQRRGSRSRHFSCFCRVSTKTAETREVSRTRTASLSAHWVAFFADCVHELRPVASGCRLAIQFSLIAEGQHPSPPRPLPNIELAGEETILALSA